MHRTGFTDLEQTSEVTAGTNAVVTDHAAHRGRLLQGADCSGASRQDRRGPGAAT